MWWFSSLANRRRNYRLATSDATERRTRRLAPGLIVPDVDVTFPGAESADPHITPDPWVAVACAM